ncbi:MAG: cell envelope protein SmpA [Oceanospirillaceae bacterium]|uniref:outer membrane protein assembly factor BamE n=1 Tax=unclassified Thalassolituus TaxID=2624967 RepID=UPI000C0B72B5|nr:MULTISPECIES: outer membrane protein assembly factor BamE [unclassified Thalassolituus]MAK89859.1 cell envelope protein SmpA [Thalassolituus sp.]MAX98826.1 cell envelope protein SmpA [Oceanospirillaceae bacterium]MAY00605.1 cell envelope protein SmpA [Oceanospirillaceae bacterium]MBS52263.1 cell envelope protein SmpA [Oceanospirillaceae bacterium]MBT10420.1 cell envelope protein SmpA [Oceanospirillaceae bacterium]|tara:strand:- start:3207 stop:3650 length:444 start_codon:yes stop_codon:yes gene_type:complete
MRQRNLRDSTLIKRATILIVSLGIATLYGCVFPGVYKLNVQQGNIVTADMLAQLKPGMNQRQVTYIMGKPVLENPFSQNRWDYIYTLEKRDEIVKNYKISLFFNEAGQYVRYEGELPNDEFSEENQMNSIPKEESSPNTIQTDMPGS